MWTLLLLAATVQSFAHMPLGASDRNTIFLHISLWSLLIALEEQYCTYNWNLGTATSLQIPFTHSEFLVMRCLGYSCMALLIKYYGGIVLGCTQSKVEYCTLLCTNTKVFWNYCSLKLSAKCPKRVRYTSEQSMKNPTIWTSCNPTIWTSCRKPSSVFLAGCCE